MIPTKIYLDLDDVLNKFTMWALRYVECPVSRKLDYSEYNPDWGYNIVAAANAIHRTRTFTKNEFWCCFDQGAWASVPVSDEFPAIMCAARAIVGDKNVYVSTRPVPYPGCLEGKRQWLARNMPRGMEENYFIGRDKFCCAKEGALMIDDVEKNCADFIKEGGNAILFPRPWNSIFSMNPGKVIGTAFAKIGQDMQKERERARRRG